MSTITIDWGGVRKITYYLPLTLSYEGLGTFKILRYEADSFRGIWYHPNGRVDRDAVFTYDRVPCLNNLWKVVLSGKNVEDIPSSDFL